MTSDQRAEVDAVLRLKKTGLKVRGKHTPDGEEGYRLFHSWEVLRVALGTRPKVDAAVIGMHDLLRDLHVTFLPPVLPKCREVAEAFCVAICPDTRSSYLFFLEEDAPGSWADLRRGALWDGNVPW